MKTSPNDQRVKALRVILISVFIFLILTIYISQDYAKIESLLRQSGYAGLLISVGLYGIMGATIVPSEPLTVLNGAMFGPLTATMVAGVGNTLAALIEYYIGSKLADVSSFQEQKERLPLGLGRLPIHSPVFLMVGRMVPGAGPKLVSVLGGVYRVPLWRYLWTTAVPTFVGAAIFAYGGFGIKMLIH